MSVGRPCHTVEIVIAPEGIMVNYNDRDWDGACGLRLNTSDRSLTALFRNGMSSKCGRVPMSVMDYLRDAHSVLWSRRENGADEFIATTEISLETV